MEGSVQRRCEVCGTSIEGKRADARYCGNTCAARARRARLKELAGAPVPVFIPETAVEKLISWYRSSSDRPLRFEATVGGEPLQVLALRFDGLVLWVEGSSGISPPLPGIEAERARARDRTWHHMPSRLSEKKRK